MSVARVLTFSYAAPRNGATNTVEPFGVTVVKATSAAVDWLFFDLYELP